MRELRRLRKVSFAEIIEMRQIQVGKRSLCVFRPSNIKRPDYWDYFYLVSPSNNPDDIPNSAQTTELYCKKCKLVFKIKRKNRIDNIKCHLKENHPDTYKETVQKGKDIKKANLEKKAKKT